MDAIRHLARPTGLVEARALVQDLLQPDPRRYWPDMLLSAAAGWAAFATAVSSGSAAVAALALAAAVLLLLRAALFIHELSHLPAGALPGFSAAWNLLVGWPLLVPSFLYVGVHTDHHRRPVYGTARDPEYLPLARGPRWRLLAFVLETVLAPAAFALRFVVLGPVSWCVPPLARWVERRASALVINFAYERRPLRPEERRIVRLQEAGVLATALLAAGLAAQGHLPWRTLAFWYVLAAGIAGINQVRTLAAHRYRNDGGPMDVIGQLADSVNVLSGPAGALWAPVGLRFHALHHFIPDLPYHALPEAHRRLARALPPDAPYHAVGERGLWPALLTLWRDAGGARGREDPRCPSSTSTAS